LPEDYDSPQDEKARLRNQVAARMLEVTAGGGGPLALPDPVFDLQLDHFITDFKDSQAATNRLVELPEWRQARRVFITPDNSTQYLREMGIRQGKEVIMTTYGIRRGSLRVTRQDVPEGQEEYASTLAGMEKFGRRLWTIADLEAAGPLDLMVTGALAVSRAHGGRAGKGAGWFDAEWGIWRSLGLAQPETPVIGIVHDAQVVPDAFHLDPWDCHLNVIVTPTEVIRLSGFTQPAGILWDQIITAKQMEWLAAIPYMEQLYRRKFGKPIPFPSGSTREGGTPAS
jgi:5-formyltetrahydrofolate cyclo-ligase